MHIEPETIDLFHSLILELQEYALSLHSPSVKSQQEDFNYFESCYEMTKEKLLTLIKEYPSLQTHSLAKALLFEAECKALKSQALGARL